MINGLWTKMSKQLNGKKKVCFQQMMLGQPDIKMGKKVKKKKKKNTLNSNSHHEKNNNVQGNIFANFLQAKIFQRRHKKP